MCQEKTLAVFDFIENYFFWMKKILIKKKKKHLRMF